MVARGWCGAHYYRWRTTGDAQAHRPVRCYSPGARCSAPECTRQARGRGLCGPHGRRAAGVTVSRQVRRHAPGAACSVPGCDRGSICRGYCVGHYSRWRSTGDVRAAVPLRPLRPVSGSCAEGGCPNSAFAVGLCQPHYHRSHRKSSPHVYDIARDRRAARKRASTPGAPAAYVDRKRIFSDSGWTCGICTEPIDPSLAWPHPGSASLDHVVPLSRGGTHTSENCQPAHLRCNIHKGARVADEPPSGPSCRESMS